jgi:TPR repeat protein
MKGIIEMSHRLRLLSLGFFCALSFPTLANDLAECKALDSNSVRACQRLAEANDPDGLFGLGFLYHEGNVVPRDENKSFQYLLRSAKLGNAAAQVQLGQAYVNGSGTSVNYEEAYAWFLVAKRNGNDVGQQGIAFLTTNRLIKADRLPAIKQRANELQEPVSKKIGFQFDPQMRQLPMRDLEEFCDQTAAVVDLHIQIRKHGHPRRDSEALMEGMTDPRAIRMSRGVIDWVWASKLPINSIREDYRNKCMRNDPELSFMFEQ